MLRRRQAKASVAAVAATAATLRREPATSAAALSPPASTNLGLKGFTHWAKIRDKTFVGAKFALPSVGEPLFFCPPPFSAEAFLPSKLGVGKNYN
jgi:hypothetical protein